MAILYFANLLIIICSDTREILMTSWATFLYLRPFFNAASVEYVTTVKTRHNLILLMWLTTNRTAMSREFSIKFEVLSIFQQISNSWVWIRGINDNAGDFFPVENQRLLVLSSKFNFRKFFIVFFFYLIFFYRLYSCKYIFLPSIFFASLIS